MYVYVYIYIYIHKYIYIYMCIYIYIYIYISLLDRWVEPGATPGTFTDFASPSTIDLAA